MASISAPTSLATFPYVHASSSRVPHITLAPVYGARGQAVAAVQGDGVWTYDIKTLPTTSFTVPPATVFTSAPVSFVPRESKSDEEEAPRVTAIGVQGTSESTGAVWIWAGEEGDKRSVALAHPVQSLHCLRGGWPIIAVGVHGSVSSVDEEGNVTQLLAPRKSRVLAARVLDAGSGEPRVALVDDRGHAAVYVLDESRASSVAEGKISRGDLLVADISADGLVTAIDATNRLHARRVRDLEAAPTIGLLLAHPASPAAVVSLPGTSPLAALGVPHPSPSVALVSPLPDLPAVLATASLSTGSTQITHLAVLSSSPLVLGTVLAHPGASGGRSVIHVADVTLPSGGVGLSALVGSAERTAAVFTRGTPPAAPAVERMIDAVAGFLRAGDVEKAETSFSSWLEDEDRKSTAVKAGRASVPEPIARRLVDAVFTAALGVPKTDAKADGNDDKDAPPTKTGPYAAKIINTLVERKAFSDAMWPGGAVLAGLVPCADWRSISRLVRSNPSLPSRVTVSLLATALSSTPIGPPPKVLEDMLAGPPPDPAFRAELRRQLSPAAAARVLGYLADWAERHAARGDGLESWPDRPHGSKDPSLATVVAHASLLLDAHLPTLMADDDAEPLLRRLSDALAPALEAQADYRRLRAPVDAALRASKVDKSEKRRETEERVGKWRVEDLVF